MKKAFILAILIKSSFAINLFPFHNTNNKANLKLKNLPNTDKIPETNLTTKPKNNCYDLNNLIHSYSNFTLKQNDLFLAKKCPINIDANTCNDSKIKTTIKSTNSAKMAIAVLDNDRKYKVLITDFNGQNAQAIAVSNAPITSVSWNQSSSSIAYVSYEAGKPIIYIQNIYTSKRYIVANFDGSNSSPAFMDNNALLVSLSKDYGTHIYKIDLNNYTPKKTAVPFVANDSIDTEASYANGNLIFTSSKSDKPQVYLKPNNSNQSKQISVGKNNTTGRISGDGLKVLYIHGISSHKYDLIYYDIKTGTSKKIDSGKILSASFAPDNNLISYIKNNQIVMRGLNNNNTTNVTNLKYREIFDVKWSK